MPEQPIATRAGLLTTQAVPVPLAGVSIEAAISTFCARVTVTQRYVNRESTPIEAVYVFPLDEGAAVCGFEAIIDGTLVIGEVKEREAAFRMYDDAMERGHGAFLLDEERPDVFQASVGNLPPGKEVLLKLTYVTELAVEGRALRFTIPTTVSPRYAPADDRVAVGRPDSEALNPPRAWRVPYGLELTVELAMTGAISRVLSPSHPVSVSMNGERATVSLSTRETALDRDFVLSVEADGLETPQAWIERDDDGTGAMAVAFVPKLDESQVPGDITFIVDRSGSMGGTSIEEVRNALQLCLRSMIPGCRFNIVGFGSTFQALFPESRAYDEASLSDASAHVAALRADLGGTEILPALQFVLEQSRTSGAVRQVVVLTDGEVTNTDAVLALAREHAAGARIFTFGIGAGASHHLVKGLARAGGGASEFIFPRERVEPKVVRQFGRLLSPAMTNVRLDWGGLEVTPATEAIAPVFAGGRLLAYAFVNAVTTATVRLTADGPSGPIAFDVPVDSTRVVPGRTAATLAARVRIRELEESPEWTLHRGSRQTERKASKVTQEIVALSTKYGLMSRETSFVAIERRETPVQGDVQLRRVPIAVTTGWGGADGAVFNRVAGMPTMAPDMAMMANPDSGFDDEASSLDSPSDRVFSRRSPLPPMSWARDVRRFLHLGDASADAKRQAASQWAPMHALVALQRADGSWDLTRKFAQAIGRDLTELEAALAGARGDRGDVRRAWATALALVWLRDYAHQSRSEWGMLAVKADRWLDGVDAEPAGGGGWIDAASAFFSQQKSGRTA